MAPFSGLGRVSRALHTGKGHFPFPFIEEPCSLRVVGQEPQNKQSNEKGSGSEYDEKKLAWRVSYKPHRHWLSLLNSLHTCQLLIVL